VSETKSKNWRPSPPSPRGVVLSILGVITLGVAILSVAVSYDILEPRFGGWAVPTVGALDALWVVFQATEVLAGNNRARARRVQYAGLALTFVNAAIPTAELVMSRTDGFDLAVVLTPIAIVATKGAWWLALPSLGRKTSAETLQTIAEKRQKVADQLEAMEAEAAHRIELLGVAKELQKRVTEAETDYRKAVLEAQKKMTEELHETAEATAKTVHDKALPPSVAAIALPQLEQLETWTPTAPALPVTPQPGGRAALEAGGTDSHAGQDDVPSGRHGGRHDKRDADRDAVALADLAAVAGVPTPEPGEQLTDGQMDVVLRHLRYRDDPPMSYRQAVTTFRNRGYVGSEKRVRHAWSALMTNEGNAEQAEETERDDEDEDADA
jgi:hypothetical protein